MRVTKYPYPDGDLTKFDAIRLIAEVLYPNDDQRDARNRVRSRIDYAQRQGRLPWADCFYAPDFFRWAVQQKGWGALLQVDGLPLAPTIANMHVHESASASCKSDGVVIPGDPARLRDAFIRGETERLKLGEELAALKERNQSLEVEVADWREKDRRLSETRSSAAKLRRSRRVF